MTYVILDRNDRLVDDVCFPKRKDAENAIKEFGKVGQWHIAPYEQVKAPDPPYQPEGYGNLEYYYWLHTDGWFDFM